jgi:2-octaprenyl-6-methoxyphenol hydroxylase
LNFHLARDYVRPRFALVGDAAHGIHPIAGQGLNLGFKDVAALSEVLLDAARLGLDFGMMDVLRGYERWRRFDSFMLAAATDALNRLFSNDFAPVRLVRDLGLGIVDAIAPVRRFFMRDAGGSAGRLPRLLRGEAA